MTAKIKPLELQVQYQRFLLHVLSPLLVLAKRGLGTRISNLCGTLMRINLLRIPADALMTPVGSQKTPMAPLMTLIGLMKTPKAPR